METLQTLEKKIESAEDLHSVVKTMKSLAAVSIRQYERAVESLTEYYRTVELGLQALVKSGMFNYSELTDYTGSSRGIIVFGADQGMSGQFDQVISEFFLKTQREREHSKDTAIIALGERLIGFLEGAGYRIGHRFAYPATVDGIITVLEEIIVVMESWRENENISLIEVMNNRPTSGSGYTPVRSMLFPLDGNWIKSLNEKDWNSPSLPMYTMNETELTASLVREHMFVTLFRGFAESLAAENASRLSAMQAAEKNIEDKLDELRTLYNQQRQHQITGELLDIISGFEALGNKK